MIENVREESPKRVNRARMRTNSFTQDAAGSFIPGIDRMLHRTRTEAAVFVAPEASWNDCHYLLIYVVFLLFFSYIVIFGECIAFGESCNFRED